jgi:steroid delta-isomerase-like uncharacterized protein
MLGAASLGSIGVLTAAMAPLARSTLAQEGTPMAGTHPIVEELVAAFNAGDLDRVMALYHDDAQFQEFPLNPEPIVGADLIRQAFSEAVTAFSEIELTAVNVVVEGDKIASETHQTARYSITIPGFPEATGQPVDYMFASFLQLEDGKIKRDTTYTDLYTVLVQIGALTEGGAA